MNRINTLFGIEYPIVQGGMVWCSGWRLASAVSNAGGLGLLGAGSMHPETLREHIRKCRQATDKPFGINVPLMYPQLDEVMQLIVDEGSRSSLLRPEIRSSGQAFSNRTASRSSMWFPPRNSPANAKRRESMPS